jgi:hypothetical protein
VQDRMLYNRSYTTGHKSYRARATIQLGTAIGWDDARDVIYAGVPDMASRAGARPTRWPPGVRRNWRRPGASLVSRSQPGHGARTALAGEQSPPDQERRPGPRPGSHQ